MSEENTKYPSFLDKDFIQIRRLDKGAFGKIFVARRKDDSKEYALKVFFDVKEKEAQSIYEETRLLVSAYHKNVVKYIDIWLDQMSLFFSSIMFN